MDQPHQIDPRGAVLVLTGWSFRDALVQTYTLPYVELMRQVLPARVKLLLVTSEQPPLALDGEGVAAVNREWAPRGMQLIAQPYNKFGLRKITGSVNDLLRLRRIIRKENVGVIHAFCTPAGSIGYLLARATGRPLVIDSYEPHAEAMVENGTWKEGGPAHRILSALERLQSRYASAFIATAAGMREYARRRFGRDPQPFFVKPACVDLQRFRPDAPDADLRRELGLEGKVVGVYAGKLGGIYLDGEVFQFLAECVAHWGDRFRFLMLTNASAAEVAAGLQRAGVPESTVIRKFVPHADVPRHLALGNFGLNPVRPVPTKRYCTSIKDGEYWATGLPVVITRDISDDSGIIEAANAGYVLRSLDREEYRRAVRHIDTLLQEDRSALRRRIRDLAEGHRNYERAAAIYKTIYA